MKKLLACLTAGLLTTGAASSVIACSQKTIPSLNDPSFALEVTNSPLSEGTFKYDILRWNSDVLNSDAYKKEFINLFKENNLGLNGSSNPWTILDLIKGQKDSNSQSPTLISKFLADYQKSSNTGDKNGDYAKAEYYDKQLTYKIYDQNNVSDKPITTFNGDGETGWTTPASDIKIKEQNGVCVIHFAIAIETKNSDQFIGARQNITEKTNLKDYYQGLKDDKDMPKTDTFDYRYDIQFYYSIN